MKKEEKKWYGSKPVHCDLCGEKFVSVFYDASVRGRWGLICRPCFVGHNCGLGTGRGQEYDLETRVKLRG